MQSRQFIRHPSGLPIEYSIKYVDSNVMEPMKNISQGGLCFNVKENITPGLSILIRIPIHTPAFEAKGIVAWCQECNERYEIGVKFTDESTEFNIRMIEQVCYIEQYRKDILENEGRNLSGEEAAMEWVEKYAKDFPR